MTTSHPAVASLLLCMGLLAAGCGDDSTSSEPAEEHSEESGIQYQKGEDYDETRGGARLLLSYDSSQDAFVGTVTNTTDGILDEVRIEVHLSNGVELGPTTPGDLPAGETADISLSADGEEFETWSAHPEVGRDEGHSGGEEEEHEGEGGESVEGDEHEAE